MEIKLLNLIIENFKGVKDFEYNFNGEDAVIKGENATGKTTVYDSLLWLFFGKDCTGRIATGKGAFGITPKDSAGKTIKGLVTCVIGKIQFGDKTHELRKELHERLGRGKQVKGYQVVCRIDEVVKTITEYKDWLAKRLDEDTFKLLTDTQFFNNDDKFPWKKRRDVLLEIAGEDIGTPEGFGKLLAELNDRTMDDYSKVLKNRKKALVEKQKEINPRIDELQRQVKAYAGGDTTELEAEREVLDTAIAQLDILREGVLTSQNERQVSLDLISELERKRVGRELELISDTSGIKKYVEEKAGIVSGIATKEQEIKNYKLVIEGKKAGLKSAEQIIANHQNGFDDARKSYTTLSDAGPSKTCPIGLTCEQEWPAEASVMHTDRLEELRKQCVESKASRNVTRTYRDKVVEEIESLETDLEKLNIELQEAITASDERIPNLDLKITGNQPKDPQDDTKWNEINTKIVMLERNLGEAPSNQLATIKNGRNIKSNELAAVERSLAASDQMKKNGTRITELETEEKEIGQKVTTLEKQIAEIAAYKKAESLIVEAAVNDKFKHVKFRLYKELLKQGEDGEQETEPTCEATLNGVPWCDMSCGERTFAGNDIINVLCEHFGVWPVLFVDNFESITMPLESNSQVICLQAVDGVKELIVV